MSIYTKMVSILVLMDLSFLREIEEEIDSKIDGFNPCSYGSFVLTIDAINILSVISDSFNPCSYGSFVLT